ncbi:hypothetical protein DXB80_08725 [Segatella copri]|uniref:Uncharacterized protein n=1 Tax=Segatella copri TaxID=165179 RepID=A0AA92VWF1_9BACT|nr:hypothetical protein DXB80_08725 [Segatella copri]
MASGDFFRLIRKKRGGQYIKNEGRDEKKCEKTCLVRIFFVYLQQNKVFKKLQKPDIQAGLIQVDLYK